MDDRDNSMRNPNKKYKYPKEKGNESKENKKINIKKNWNEYLKENPGNEIAINIKIKKEKKEEKEDQEFMIANEIYSTSNKDKNGLWKY